MSKKFLALELILDVLVDQGMINMLFTPKGSLILIIAAGVKNLSFKEYYL